MGNEYRLIFRRDIKKIFQPEVLHQLIQSSKKNINSNIPLVDNCKQATSSFLFTNKAFTFNPGKFYL
jgi:hypothetical protein